MRWYQQLKNIYHWLQAQLWRVVYRWPDRRMTIYAVTGTNGKTTTCHLLASILRQAKGTKKVGMLTTIAFWFGEQEVVNETKMTTLPSKLVYRYLRQMADAGITHVVMEVTSHALDQHRLVGLSFAGAIVLNIQREHLDYHRTMSDYTKAKARIIGYLTQGAPIVVKKDDEWIQKVIVPLLPPTRIFFTGEEARVVSTPLLGEVNKENALAATLLARAIGIDQTAIERGIAQVKQVPGRMEWINMPETAPRVLIDYAVTPDALERLYKTVREETNGTVFAVLGACGLRDRGKRPDMARVVAQYADELVLTREDPWTEPEEQIFSDLEQGLVPPLTRGGQEGFVWQRIVDRREAIRYCLQKAVSGDVVVVTGKGAETGMAIGNEVIPWNDKKVILELVREHHDNSDH